jgi:cytochrome c-type biogenesis protein CcmE
MATAGSVLHETYILARDGLHVVGSYGWGAVSMALKHLEASMVAVWALTSAGAAAWAVKRPRHGKVALSLLVIAGAVGFLAILAVRAPPEYYKQVHEIVADPQPWRDRHLQIHGYVACGSLERARGTDRYRFKVESTPGRPPAVISVDYTGRVPAAFQPGAEVVVKGRLRDDGGFDAAPDGIMAKCPSKYDLTPRGPLCP